MRSERDRALSIAWLLPILCVVSFAEANVADSDSVPLYRSAADIQANMPANVDGKTVVYRAMSGPQIQILAARAVKTGEAEMHRAIDVVYYVPAGHADVLVGSKVEGGNERAPNEWSGGKIVDGHTYSLSQGDVLLIPAGSAHQVIVPQGGSFSYMVFRHASVSVPGK